MPFVKLQKVDDFGPPEWQMLFVKSVTRMLIIWMFLGGVQGCVPRGAQGWPGVAQGCPGASRRADAIREIVIYVGS